MSAPSTIELKVQSYLVERRRLGFELRSSGLGGCPRIRLSNEYSLIGFGEILKIRRPNLKLTKTYRALTLELVHDGLIQCIFTYIAGFVVKFPNFGRINPVTMALAIFLKLCAAHTIENSPATFSLPRTLKPRNPLFLI